MLSSQLGSSRVFNADHRPRVAVGRIWQETNSFNSLLTRWEDFDVVEGDDVIAAYRHSTTPLSGIIGTLERVGAVPQATIAATARPGGRVDDEAFGRIRDRLLAWVRKAQPDAVCLELHGSIAATTTDDVEGVLLSSLRQELGPDIPIVAALDLHGHVTDRMVAAADLLTGYRTQPHADLVETGDRAARLLAAIMLGEISPVARRVSLPFLALTNDETDDPPLRSVARLVEQLSRELGPRLIDLSIFNVHPFLDVAGVGQVVLAYGQNDADAAKEAAEKVATALVGVKREFVREPESVLTQLIEITGKAGSGMIVIGDQGDSVLAGTPGDSVEIARFALQHAPTLRGLFPVFDPAAVAAATDAGIGQSISIDIGGAFSPGLEPMHREVRIEALTDGAVINVGSYMQGVRTELGPCAVLNDGPRHYLATSKPPSVCDPALISHAGLSPDDLDLLVVKSGNHFKLSFSAPYRCAVAATTGLSNRDPKNLRHRAARPIFPIDDI